MKNFFSKLGAMLPLNSAILAAVLIFLPIIPLAFGWNLISLCVFGAETVLFLLLTEGDYVRKGNLLFWIVNLMTFTQMVNLHLSVAPWRPTNHIVIAIYAIVVLVLLVLPIVENWTELFCEFGSKTCKNAWGEVLNMIPIGIIFFSLWGLVSYFGSQMIWLIPGYLLVTSCMFIIVLRSKLKDLKGIAWVPIFGLQIALLTALVSTFIQYWGTTTLIICITIAVGILILASVSIRKSLNKRRAKKEEKALKAKQEAERLEKIKEEEAQKHSKLMKKRNELVEGIGPVDWQSVQTLWGNDRLPDAIFFRPPIFWKASDVKQQMSWNPKILQFMATSVSAFYAQTMDDEKLAKLKQALQGMITSLDHYQNFKGYQAIFDQLEEYLDEAMLITFKIRIH